LNKKAGKKHLLFLNPAKLMQENETTGNRRKKIQKICGENLIELMKLNNLFFFELV